jgi:hypothetical protein
MAVATPKHVQLGTCLAMQQKAAFARPSQDSSLWWKAQCLLTVKTLANARAAESYQRVSMLAVNTVRHDTRAVQEMRHTQDK